MSSIASRKLCAIQSCETTRRDSMSERETEEVETPNGFISLKLHDSSFRKAFEHDTKLGGELVENAERLFKEGTPLTLTDEPPSSGVFCGRSLEPPPPPHPRKREQEAKKISFGTDLNTAICVIIHEIKVLPSQI